MAHQLVILLIGDVYQLLLDFVNYGYFQPLIDIFLLV
jgi:hypothetical protein